MFSRAWLPTAASALLLAAFASPAARADSGLGALGLDPNSLVSPDVVKALVSFIGFGTQHRPYEPATPLGVSVGLDLSLEVTLFKVPDSLFTSLASAGVPSASPLPSLPAAKFHLHKGFGEFVDLGASFFYLPGNWIVGGDIKIVISQGEEGPTYAFRFCYTYTDLSINGISISTKTYSPQLLMSRQMEFADPYLGVALEYATGEVSGTVTVPTGSTSVPAGVTIPPQAFSPPGAAAYGGYAFGGVSLKIPRSGLRLTLEGSYNTAGTSTTGVKIGFTF